MEIAVSACFFAKGDVDVNAGHCHKGRVKVPNELNFRTLQFYMSNVIILAI